MSTQRKAPFQIGQFYHVYNRGNNHQLIFYDRENYLYFLRLIRHHLVANGIDILAYCLMPNHYHLLVHLSQVTLSQSMKSLSLAYTKALNKYRDRSGSLFQGRFQAIHVDQPDYLIYLCRYIHLNPVKAGIVQHPDEWEFSSYLEYAGLRSGNLPNLGFVKTQIETEHEYHNFLHDHLLPSQAMLSALLLDN